MKKVYFLLFFVLTCFQITAQGMRVDIFGNLEYESREQQYKAVLKQTIFDDLTFSDSRNNEITYSKKYLEFKFRAVLQSEDAKMGFFTTLIHKYRLDANYKAKYSVDVFNKVTIKDNRNTQIQYGTDIFGNLEFRTGKIRATLKKDVFNNMVYEDGTGNKIQYSQKSWNHMLVLYGSNEHVFDYLLDEFLEVRNEPTRPYQQPEPPKDRRVNNVTR